MLFEKTRNKSDDARFFYYCITVGMASIKIVSFRKLYQIQSQVIQGSLKSRDLDKTRVIYDLISLEAICLHKRSISVEKLLNVISNRSVNHRVCRYRHRNKTYLPIKRRGSYWPKVSLNLAELCQSYHFSGNLIQFYEFFSTAYHVPNLKVSNITFNTHSDFSSLYSTPRNGCTAPTARCT